MQRLLELLFKYKRFFLFVFLEFWCFILIVRNNPYQSASYYSSSNAVLGTVFAVTNSITGYFSLSSENDVLAEENALLRQEIESLKGAITDQTLQKLPAPDTNFIFTPALVINNSIDRENNFITLNRGAKDSIRVGMGVVSNEGVVGRVVSVSKNFSTVMSFLHPRLRVSGEIKRSRVLGSVHWKSESPTEAHFEFVPRHEKIVIGDEVVTSGFNSVFPEGIPVGEIVSTDLSDHASFHDIKIRFANDFSALKYVYVIDNKRQTEQKELETQTLELEQ